MAQEGSNLNSAQSIDPWRRALKSAVAAILVESGYNSTDIAALETLLEMTQAFILQVGMDSSRYCELAGRTHVMPADVVIALIEIGFDIQGIPAYAKRDNKSLFLPPGQVPATGTSKILQVGEKRKHPQHISDNLPAFPDPHTYIKTPSFRQPANEYQQVRERTASQKRDVEVALTRFIAKTGETHSLFKDDKNSFPLIACKPQQLPYLSALLPKDSSLEQEDKADTNLSELKPSLVDSQSALPGDPVEDGDIIDNPYLRPVKMARKSTR